MGFLILMYKGSFFLPSVMWAKRNWCLEFGSGDNVIAVVVLVGVGVASAAAALVVLET